MCNILHHFDIFSHPGSLSEVIKGGVEQLASNLTNRETGQVYASTSDYRPVNGLPTIDRRSQVTKHYGSSSSKVDLAKPNEYKAVNITESTSKVQLNNLQGTRQLALVNQCFSHLIMQCCRVFHSNETIHNSNLSKTEGCYDVTLHSHWLNAWQWLSKNKWQKLRKVTLHEPTLVQAFVNNHSGPHFKNSKNIVLEVYCCKDHP